MFLLYFLLLFALKSTGKILRNKKRCENIKTAVSIEKFRLNPYIDVVKIDLFWFHRYLSKTKGFLFALLAFSILDRILSRAFAELLDIVMRSLTRSCSTSLTRIPINYFRFISRFGLLVRNLV